MDQFCNSQHEVNQLYRKFLHKLYVYIHAHTGDVINFSSFIESHKTQTAVLHLVPMTFVQFFIYRLGLPDQALGGILLGFGVVSVKDKPSKL